ncbi:hypothetical protein [uncultured Treponema sp.]|uniref:hypothetical protein n=1 Tax=uncultured Treponema sp. TaxID=162155 RepID=UPI0025FC9BE0|nr:hypothetical protein [uncultured Treponema sp.]
MYFEEAVALIVMLVLTVIIVGVLLNQAFWQGYRNSKFLDELKKERNEWMSEERNLME